MKTLLSTLLIGIVSMAVIQADETAHNFVLKDIDGNKVPLEKYKGNVVLFVNVASKCGYTPQYENLQNLHEKFKDEGLVVIGVPANNFGGQEPGTDEEIKEFCTTKYEVTFPMMSKVSVQGEDQDDLYGYLTQAENPDFTGPIKWNFEKVLVGKDGEVKRRFRSGAEPDSEEVVSAVKKALEE